MVILILNTLYDDSNYVQKTYQCYITKQPSFSPTTFVCGRSFILKKNKFFTKKLRKKKKSIPIISLLQCVITTVIMKSDVCQNVMLYFLTEIYRYLCETGRLYLHLLPCHLLSHLVSICVLNQVIDWIIISFISQCNGIF